MERERPEKENTRPNATYYYTESGNKVYVAGTSRKNNKPVRVRVGRQFVKVYDKNFKSLSRCGKDERNQSSRFPVGMSDFKDNAVDYR